MALHPLTVRTPEQLAPLLVSVFSLILASSAVFLRVLAHHIKGAVLGVDDFIIFAAIVSVPKMPKGLAIMRY